MKSLLREFLQGHSEGVTLAGVARDVLKLTGPPTTVESLAEAALRDAGASPRGDGRWVIADRAPMRRVAVAGLCTGPYPGLDQLVEVAAVEVAAEGVAREFASLVRPLSLSFERARDLLGPAAGALSSAPGLAEARRGLDPLIRGARLISLGDEDTAAHLSRLPGTEPGGRPLELGRVLWRLGLIGRGPALQQAAERFGHPLPPEPRALDRARATAAVFAACIEQEIPVEEPPAPRERFDFSGLAVDRSILEGLPSRPGVYRFFDRKGALLYVGQTKDLRRRVAGYFAHRGRRRQAYAAMMERLHRIDWEETGSEIMALLLEAQRIREDSPLFNVQRVVRRRRGLQRNAAVLLPGRNEGEIEILFLRDGAPVGRAASDRRARGMRGVRRALRLAYFAPAQEASGEEALAITSSWLRREEDSVNLIDIGAAAGVDDAARMVRSALTDPELFARKSFYR